MIPKIIHYCWFGRGQMPELGVKCIESWKKFLPDYQLMLWNEESFDVNKLRFTREAYAQKRYAFVTDYVRLWALNTYGGVYMDTDVEIIRNIDSFLDLPAFSGFESNDLIPTGIMASVPQARWLQPLLAYYDKKPFVRWNGRLNRTPNTLIISRIFNKRGIRLDNSYQVWENELHLFPQDYFCPKSYRTGMIECTDNTYCIHHFAGSWTEAAQQNRQRFGAIRRCLKRLFS